MKRTIFIASAAALMMAILWFMQWSGLWILIPKINGTVTVHQENAEQTFRFSDRGGEYGEYHWQIGSEKLPISVRLFSRNSRHVINMDFDVEQLETEWHVTGVVRVKTYEPVQYEAHIPLSEPIVISVTCFP